VSVILNEVKNPEGQYRSPQWHLSGWRTFGLWPRCFAALRV